MENRVGDNVPSEAVLTKLLTNLHETLTGLRKFGITLSADERKRLLHARNEAGPHLERTAKLAAKYGITVPGIPLDGMKNDMRLATSMIPFIDAANSLKQLVDDTGGAAESEYWQAFLAHYGVLSSMAARNPELAIEYKETIDFMAHGPRKKPAAPAK